MAAFRLVACLVLVVFAVQLALGGVQRRDAPAPSGANVLEELQAGFRSLGAQLQSLAQEHNASALLDQLGAQLTALQSTFTEVANNVSQHLSAGGAGAGGGAPH